MNERLKIDSEVFTIEKGFELWIQNCKRRGLSMATIDYYNSVANIFMDNIYYKTKIEEINSKVIDRFILLLQDKNVKTTSINSYLNGIRSVCNWWAREEYLDSFKIDKIKCDEVIKETFTEEEIKILLKRPNIKSCAFLIYEAYTLCNLLYGLGTRASTICNLKIKDIDLDNGYIFYGKTKNRKQTIIPIGKTLIYILKEFLLYRKGNPDDYVFVNAHGKKLDKDRLYEIMKRYYLSKGVTKTGIHIWRHTFARDYIKNGGNALKLQAQLCHATLDMTKKYVNLYGNDMRDDINNPLELLNSKNEKINMIKWKEK